MTAYILGQEYNDLHWGTRMPVALMIGSDYFEVRARGDCSLAVQDIQKLQAQIPDPEDLTAYLGSLLSSSITDVIGALSTQVSNIAQLTVVTEQTLSSLQSNLEPKCSELGLKIKSLKIEAIESI
jgi:membrane protease subunit (stomatin/prohibitin family)